MAAADKPAHLTPSFSLVSAFSGQASALSGMASHPCCSSRSTTPGVLSTYGSCESLSGLAEMHEGLAALADARHAAPRMADAPLPLKPLVSIAPATLNGEGEEGEALGAFSGLGLRPRAHPTSLRVGDSCDAFYL